MKIADKVEASIQSPVDEVQIRGYLVIVGQGHMVKQAVGTPTGLPFSTEAAAEELARQIEEHSRYDAVVLPLIIPSEF